MRQIRDLPPAIARELALHDAWRMGHCCGRRADLRGADLRGVDFTRADFAHADLRGADLRGADFTHADFTRADLTGAYLTDADLTNANFTYADLTSANFTYADFTRADFIRADLTGAQLIGTNLTNANFTYADLTRVDLTRAGLRGADLRGADLTDARGLAYQIPQEGELIVYKHTTGGAVKLRIPPDAKRTASIVGRKCRAEWAEVLEGEGDSTSDARGPILHYAPGLTVYPDSYDPDPRVECSHGIHFFLSREEAE